MMNYLTFKQVILIYSRLSLLICKKELVYITSPKLADKFRGPNDRDSETIDNVQEFSETHK